MSSTGPSPDPASLRRGGGPSRPRVAPPDLRLWRHGADACSQAAAEGLADCLGNVAILHEDRWPEALSEPSVAIGIAMRNLVPSARPEAGLLDVVMSCVLLHARRGQPACALVLDHVRAWAAMR